MPAGWTRSGGLIARAGSITETFEIKTVSVDFGGRKTGEIWSRYQAFVRHIRQACVGSQRDRCVPPRAPCCDSANVTSKATSTARRWIGNAIDGATAAADDRSMVSATW